MLKRNEKKTQEFVVNNDFEIEESNATKILKAKGEVNSNPHTSNFNCRKVSKFENFWYHHYWHIGLSIAAIVVVVLIVVSIVTKVDPDVNVVYAGYADTSSGRYQRLQDAFLDVMGDYNNDGKYKLNFTDYQYYTESQIEERKAAGISIDSQQNAENYTEFSQIIGTGDYMFCMLDPELHDNLVAIEAFIPLSDVFDEVPSSAYGEYGIRLGSTEFYKSHSEIQFLPPDTILAIRVTSSLNISSEEKKQQLQDQHKELLKDIVNYTASKTEN